MLWSAGAAAGIPLPLPPDLEGAGAAAAWSTSSGSSSRSLTGTGSPIPVQHGPGSGPGPPWHRPDAASIDLYRSAKLLCDQGRVHESVGALEQLVARGGRAPTGLLYRLLKRCTPPPSTGGGSGAAAAAAAGDDDDYAPGAAADTLLAAGRRVQAVAAASGLGGDDFMATHLVGMFGAHRRVEEAAGVFARVRPAPSAHTWAAAIFAHARNGAGPAGVALFRRMVRAAAAAEPAAARPDNRVYVAALKACAAAGDLGAGKEVHAHVMTAGGGNDGGGTGPAGDVFVLTGLLDMYAKCGSLADARAVFDRLPHKTTVTWNAMMSAYAAQGQSGAAFALYHQMQQQEAEGAAASPDAVTCVCLLQACAGAGVPALPHGRALHAHILRRGPPLADDVVVGGSLVNMYAKCAGAPAARAVFDTLRAKNTVTWNAMLAACAQHGDAGAAFALYTAMLSGANAASGVVPNSVTYVCLLQAAAAVAALPLGARVHAHIPGGLLAAHPAVGVALVDMYAKCGAMAAAQAAFDALPGAGAAGTPPCAAAWTALIGGYTRHGDAEAALAVYAHMRARGVAPTPITYTCVLAACSHAGLVDAGLALFAREVPDADKTIEHYTCVVDLLGRAGRVGDAARVAREMPFPPDAAVWDAVLAACGKWPAAEGVVAEAEAAFAAATRCCDTAAAGENGGAASGRPLRRDSAPYVLMANVYARAGMWHAARAVQAARVDRGAWKEPGRSWWTDPADGVVHAFCAVGLPSCAAADGAPERDRDRTAAPQHHHHPDTHPDTDLARAWVDEVVGRAKRAGYVPHLESALREGDDADKEAELCGHCEKLAIAYALRKAPAGSTIRIVKNLRVCDDCHTATAWIAKVEGRTIICRDGSRFHVFKDGACSCGNYW